MPTNLTTKVNFFLHLYQFVYPRLLGLFQLPSPRVAGRNAFCLTLFGFVPVWRKLVSGTSIGMSACTTSQPPLFTACLFVGSCRS